MLDLSAEFSELVMAFVEMQREVAALRRHMANAIKVGTITDVDAKKGYRIGYATVDGAQKKSAWYPHPEQGADSRSWVPLSKGEVVAQICPPGDTRQALIVRGGFCDQYKQPSDKLDEDVFTRGKSRITNRADEIRVEMVDLNEIAQGTIDAKAKKNIQSAADVDLTMKAGQALTAEAKTKLTAKADKWVGIKGEDELKLQGKKKRIHMHSDVLGLFQARQSIIIQAPSVVIKMSDPGKLPDATDESEAKEDADAEMQMTMYEDEAFDAHTANLTSMAGIAGQVMSGNFSGLTGMLSGVLSGGQLGALTGALQGVMSGNLSGITSALGNFIPGNVLGGITNISGLTGALQGVMSGDLGGLSTVLSNFLPAGTIGSVDIGGLSGALSGVMSGNLSAITNVVSSFVPASLMSNISSVISGGVFDTLAAQIVPNLGSFVAVPSIVNGVMYGNISDAIAAIPGGLSALPAYASAEEATSRMAQMAVYMARDVAAKVGV